MIFEIVEIYGDQVIKLYYTLKHSDKHGHGLWFSNSGWAYTGLGAGGDVYSAKEAEPEFLRSSIIALFEQGDVPTMLNQFNEFEARNEIK